MELQANGDVMRELEQLDQWLDGTAEGGIPLEMLRGRGMDIPEDDAALEDAAVHAKLWEIVRAMADFGMVIDSPNHLSDRELYRWLVGDCLRQETLFAEEGGLWHFSPIGGGSEEDNEIFLRYYADDETREVWRREAPEMELPPKEVPPYDRDRFLPGAEDELELLIR
jgi:hypothetical protein